MRPVAPAAPRLRDAAGKLNKAAADPIGANTPGSGTMAADRMPRSVTAWARIEAFIALPSVAVSLPLLPDLN